MATFLCSRYVCLAPRGQVKISKINPHRRIKRGVVNQVVVPMPGGVELCRENRHGSLVVRGQRLEREQTDVVCSSEGRVEVYSDEGYKLAKT